MQSTLHTGIHMYNLMHISNLLYIVAGCLVGCELNAVQIQLPYNGHIVSAKQLLTYNGGFGCIV